MARGLREGEGGAAAAEASAGPVPSPARLKKGAPGEGGCTQEPSRDVTPLKRVSRGRGDKGTVSLSSACQRGARRGDERTNVQPVSACPPRGRAPGLARRKAFLGTHARDKATSAICFALDLFCVVINSVSEMTHLDDCSKFLNGAVVV